MIRTVFFATCATVLLAAPLAAETPKTQCEELIDLFIELGERSGETVTLEEARAEVMSENPTDEECAAMLSLFPAQD
ncbi:MAG: hypothetical protein AAFY43_08435 [Pseudomonadota bacterium]